jgi:hypothetical protein
LEYLNKAYTNTPVGYAEENAFKDTIQIKRTVNSFKGKEYQLKSGKKYYKHLSLVYVVYDSADKCDAEIRGFCKNRMDYWDIDSLLKGKEIEQGKSVPLIIVVNKQEIVYMDTYCENTPKDWTDIKKQFVECFLDKNTGQSYFIEAECAGSVKLIKSRN